MATKRKRFEVPVGAVYALLAAMSLICVTVLAVALAGDNGSGDREKAEAPRERLPHLYIEDVYFRSRESLEVTLDVIIYITNDGTADAENVVVHIWPIVEGSNIATDMDEVEFGRISVNQTSKGQENIEFQAGTVHSVEILIFASDKMLVKGRATVSTNGEAGAEFNTVEVRGTTGDMDYDGIPDNWERHYGLDPEDPTDALQDNDHDGFTNLDEYKLSRDPTLTPAEEEEPDDNDVSISTLFEGGDEQSDSTIALGAGLFLILILGVIVVLIIGAVMSRRKLEKESEENRTPSVARSPPERKNNSFPVEVREGYSDDPESDLPDGMGKYE